MQEQKLCFTQSAREIRVCSKGIAALFSST